MKFASNKREVVLASSLILFLKEFSWVLQGMGFWEASLPKLNHRNPERP